VIAHSIGDAFRSALVIEPVDRDIGTRRGKFDRHRAADPLLRPCDQDHLAGALHLWISALECGAPYQVLGRIQMIHYRVSCFDFPAKAGTHFRDGHRPSPVWRSFFWVALFRGGRMDRLNGSEH
jgi:hypothetical protein